MPSRKTKAQILRGEIHRLVDDLPDKELYGARRFLAYLRNLSDPRTLKFMEAPYDDELLTTEEQAALDKAWEDVAAGRTVSMEELKRELGL